MDDFLKDLKSKNKEFSEEYIEEMKKYYQKMLQNPAQFANQLNPAGKNEIDAEGGITIIPEKNFCIKTQDTSKQKIFINILSHDQVEAPKEQHILEINNQQGVRIPLSVSERYEDFDVKGNICQVYDVIINPSIATKAANDPMVLQFVMTIIAGRIKERFKHDLDVTNFIKLKNVQYKGKAVKLQRIRARKVKIDEVMSGNDNGNNKQGQYTQQGTNVKEISKEVNERGRTPKWSFVIVKEYTLTNGLYKSILDKSKDILNGYITFDMLKDNNQLPFEYFNGVNANPKYGDGLALVIELELLTKSTGIKLNVCDESLTLYCGKFYSLELNLIFKVDSNHSNAVFDNDKRLLLVFLPFYTKDITEFRTISQKEKAVTVSEDYLYDVIH